jgi:hypothetical protein
MAAELAVGRTPVRQFSLFLVNRTGSFLSLLRLMGESGVEVLGHSVHDSVDLSMVRMVVSDPETTRERFRERGISFGEHEVFCVELPGGASDLARCLAELLAAEVNLHFSYPLMVRPRGKAVLVVSADEPEFSEGVLMQAGFQVLGQAELSR